jgi:hypothetical protein
MVWRPPMAEATNDVIVEMLRKIQADVSDIA